MSSASEEAKSICSVIGILRHPLLAAVSLHKSDSEPQQASTRMRLKAVVLSPTLAVQTELLPAPVSTSSLRTQMGEGIALGIKDILPNTIALGFTCISAMWEGEENTRSSPLTVYQNTVSFSPVDP
jgi:hypothetical protein